MVYGIIEVMLIKGYTSERSIFRRGRTPVRPAHPTILQGRVRPAI